MATATQERPATGKTVYNVMVRHSPFLLKNANIEAANPDEAKRLFLEATNRRVAQRTSKVDENSQLDPETMQKTKRAIILAHEKGMEAASKGELEFVIRPAAEVEAARTKYNEDREKVWRREKV